MFVRASAFGFCFTLFFRALRKINSVTTIRSLSSVRINEADFEAVSNALALNVRFSLCSVDSNRDDRAHSARPKLGLDEDFAGQQVNNVLWRWIPEARVGRWGGRESNPHQTTQQMSAPSCRMSP